MNATPKKSFPRPRILFTVLLLFILLLDQITKHIIVKTIPLGKSRVIIHGFFNLTYVRNDGIAFGLLQGNNLFMGLIVVAILITGLWWTRKLDWKKFEINLLAALIVGGALGNLVDRWNVGHVIDFLEFHWKTLWSWPAFNIADSCISLSMVYLFFRLMWSKPKKEK